MPIRQGDNMTTTKAIKVVKATKQTIQVYVNSPKLNEVHANCQGLRAYVRAKGATVEGLTALGHKVGCKGGVIDSVILTAQHLTLDEFVRALVNSQLGNVKADIAKYGYSLQLQAVLAKRVIDHVTWCANTSNQQHGGFGSRLAKVSLHDSRQIISNDLQALANNLKASYKAQYSKIKAIKAIKA